MATLPNGSPENFPGSIPIPPGIAGNIPSALPELVSSAAPVNFPLENTVSTAPHQAQIAGETSSASSWWNLEGRRSTHFILFLTDLFFASINAGAVFYALLASRGGLNPIAATQYRGLLLLYSALTLLCCENYGLYRIRRTGPISAEILAIVRAVLSASLLLAGFISAANIRISMLTITATGIMNVASFAAWRVWERRTALQRINPDKMRNVLIVGANTMGQRLARLIEKNPQWGYTVQGFLDDTRQSNGIKVLGTMSQLVDIGRAEFIDEIFVAPPYHRDLVWKLAEEARRHRWDIKVIPEFWEPNRPSLQFDVVGDLPVFSLHSERISAGAVLIKRCFDIAASLLGLLVSFPLFAAIALAIKLDSPGPVFYCSYRIGRKGRKFRFYKLRTMVINADEIKQQLRANNQRLGPFFKMSRDPRITCVGRFLRKSSLDELPQLWNVLKGDMSLVGPRPHPVDDYEKYTLEHLRRLDVRPGLTGLWQVKARRDPLFETNMALDLTYIKNWSLWLDLKILLLTLPAVLRGTGQ